MFCKCIRVSFIEFNFFQKFENIVTPILSKPKPAPPKPEPKTEAEKGDNETTGKPGSGDAPKADANNANTAEMEVD